MVDYDRDLSLNNILENFDNEIDEISKEKLANFIFTKMLSISNNSKNLKPSHLKTFSISHVSIIFIYQELFEAHSQAFFNSCINTTRHKESIASLIRVACEFGDLYASLDDKNKVSYLNNIFISELKKVKNDVEDNANFKSILATLFDENGSFSPQNHLLQIVEIQSHFIEEKFFLKNNIFTLLLLFENYKDEKLSQLYQHIKIMCNIHITKDNITKDEIINITNDYFTVTNREHLETFNNFFMRVCEHIKNYYLCQIDKEYIDISFAKISQDIRVPKWHDIMWIKKDNRLLARNSIKIQKELRDLQPDYSELSLSSKIFENNFKVFSSISILINEYDTHFNTIDKLSNLLNHDFTKYHSIACMNIKNFYEKTDSPIEIEAINRFIIFWSLINDKSYLKKMGITL